MLFEIVVGEQKEKERDTCEKGRREKVFYVPFVASSSLNFRVDIRQINVLKIIQCLDSNQGPLVAFPIDPQPLP